MTRQADPESKTLRLTLCPKPGQAEKIRAFKELAARNNLKISDILYEKVEEFLKKHNYPPGNSQTLILTYADGKGFSLGRRVPRHACKYYREDPQGEPFCSMDWGGSWRAPERCYSCDTGRYSRPET